MSEPIEVFVTKWCISSGGVERTEAYVHPLNKDWCIVSAGRMRQAVLHEGDWFKTEVEALAEMEAIRKRMIAYHERQINHLEGTEVKVYDGP